MAHGHNKYTKRIVFINEEKSIKISGGNIAIFFQHKRLGGPPLQNRLKLIESDKLKIPLGTEGRGKVLIFF